MRYLFPLTLLLAIAAPLAAQKRSAAELGRALRGAGLDPAECYRVRDLDFSQEEEQFYLTSGYLIFGRPVNGAPVTAVFSAEAEGGDAEVLLLPPDRAERKTLARHTGAPNLNEHFKTAIFFFTDAHVRALLERVRANADSEAGSARKMPEVGALLADRWNATVANIAGSFDSRIVLDLINERADERGFFEALIEGRKLGNFDLLYDPRAYEQLEAGQITTQRGRTVWDTWTTFATKSRQGVEPPAPEERIIDYRIDAALDPALVLHCVTRIRIQATQDSRAVLPFDFSGQMRATGAKVDGVTAEIYERESVRTGIVQNNGNELLLVVPPQPLQPGSEHEIEIEHEGKVVIDAGRQVYFVSARGMWYPSRGMQFARYDVTYRYPKTLDLVGAGQVTEDRTEGDTRVTRRVTDRPIRVLGFNLGQYERKKVAQGGIEVEVCANREIEEALRRASLTVDRPVPPDRSMDAVARMPGRRPRFPAPVPLDDPQPAPPPPPARPADELARIAGQIGSAMEFYRARFGAPPSDLVEVSPVPGRFGQGFAGMIYLSTLSYFPLTARPLASMGRFEQTFYSELMPAHEAAHQWWGNVVTAGSYHHEWIMEALANYSAMMFLETRKGPKFVDGVLDEYRRQLLRKTASGETVESGGPVVQGSRLEEPDSPNAWPTIVYGKGTWIIHMLRRRMGDPQFTKMLAELRRRYERKTIGTEEFRGLCAEFLPAKSADPKLEDFFDQWVYGTGIPALKLDYSVKGKPGAYTLTGTVTQSDADRDFTITVPVEVQTGRGKPVIKMVRTGSEPATFSVSVAGLNPKATLDPGLSILRR